MALHRDRLSLMNYHLLSRTNAIINVWYRLVEWQQAVEHGNTGRGLGNLLLQFVLLMFIDRQQGRTAHFACTRLSIICATVVCSHVCLLSSEHQSAACRTP